MNCECNENCNFVPIGIMSCGGDASTGGGVSYSYEEQDTGLTWVDGKKIYQKTIMAAWPTSVRTWRYTAHDIINIDNIVGFDGVIIEEEGAQSLPMPYVRPLSAYSESYLYSTLCTRTQIGVIASHFSGSSIDVYVTIRYTCTDR